ncbi:MAG: DUF2145 domain-containing protein [Comamonadaceae bacterium]|nr:DUF2145 domain-containing protein [Comamonadaceae bacterium]
MFDQGHERFRDGRQRSGRGYLSIVLLPDAAAAPIERATRDDQQALKLLGDTYSANAYAFSTRYQNCNQWLAELMASAWAPAADAGENRTRAAGADRGRLRPTGWSWAGSPLVWLAGQIRWLHTDDHPADDPGDARFRVRACRRRSRLLCASRSPTPGALELCYTATPGGHPPRVDNDRGRLRRGRATR